MDIQRLIAKGKMEALSDTEQQELLAKVYEEIAALKSTDPEKYLNLVTHLNEAVESLNADLRDIAAS